MENPLLVFISSVIGGMAAERQAAQVAIQAIPLSRPWAFEHSPASSKPLAESYLSHVRGCDIFVLLLGAGVTDPVKAEVQTAQAAGKPLLVFLSAQAPAGVADYARSLGVKYATYTDADSLAAALAEAVSDELITGYRRHSVPPTDWGRIGEFVERVKTGGGAVVFGSVHTGGGDFVGRDKIIQGDEVSGDKVMGNKFVYGDEPPDDLLQAYYRAVSADCRRLPLGVIDTEFVRTSGEQPVPLPDIYVDLDVVAPAQERGEGERAWALRLMRGEGGDRTKLLAALAEPPAARTVLLGDPGSGKTTFVNYLTYLLSTHDAALPVAWRDLLPVRLVLRDVAARCIPSDAQVGTAAMLWNALACDIASHLGQAAAGKLLPYLQKRLLAEGGFFLLDGLDEVPEAHRRRVVLLQAVRALSEALADIPARLLVTARPYAYADKRWRLPQFATLALAPFSEEQATRFVARWYAAVRPFMGWDKATASSRAGGLQTALQERPYLADLASRPLLLTLMATLHSSWGQLPEDRASLYEETVKLLLGRWQRQRETRSPDGELVVEPGIAQALGVGEARIRTALESLAYRAHAAQREHGDRDGGPADVSEGDVLQAFKPLLGEVKPDVILAYLKERAGLLIARREEVYAFPHRSFQEYLAACHLANTEPEFATRLRELVWQDPSWWREVFLLGIGKKRQGGLGDAINVINTLAPQEPEQLTGITETHWRAAALAGQAIAELRLGDAATQQPHYGAVVERTRRWLVRLVEGGELPVRERLAAGDILGRLGDPRPGVGVVSDRTGRRPDALWVEIPAGAFTMGSPEGDADAWDNERPAHTVKLPAYFMGRYPVTNAQYALFVADGGYQKRELWTPAGWAWRKGTEADLTGIDDVDLKRKYVDWLARRPADRRDQPFYWGDPRWGAATRPVVGVCWHEALAYCRWLQEQLARRGHELKIWQPGRVTKCTLEEESYTVRLPSEAEWEQAARGPKGSRWPWGNKWQEGRANTEETGLGETSPVGMFPDGANSFGLLDMAGNVWEWTRSRWGRQSIYIPDYRYPYHSDDGREELDGSDLRVLRGGSWDYDRGEATCAFRLRDAPVDFLNDFGFRVVVSLSNSGF